MTHRPLPEKLCATCGRTMRWRKRWARDWDSVRHCSSACRGGLAAIDRELEEGFVALLRPRPRSSSLCPSEVARMIRPGDWRPLMEPARRAARRLHAAGVVEITQGGRTIDPSTARGPIRVRKGTAFPSDPAGS